MVIKNNINFRTVAKSMGLTRLHVVAIEDTSIGETNTVPVNINSKKSKGFFFLFYNFDL